MAATSTPAAAPPKAKKIYTEEKAVHLIRVYGALVSGSLLIGWLHVILINPMKQEVKDMAHMDPSEIIAMPYSLQRLTVFVMFPVVIVMILWLVKSPDKMTSNLLSWIKLTLTTFGMFIICGAHVVDNYKHSITAAAYLATLMSTTWTGKVTSNILEELPFYDYTNLLAASRLYCMILFTIPFQVLSALDRGIQIQRWPLPIILGATYGFVLGTMVGVFLLGAQNRQKNRRTKD